MLRDYPAAVRLYDILREGAEDLRGLPFVERRDAGSKRGMRRAPRPALDLSPMVPFASWTSCANCATAHAIVASKG